jgi:hypothetical protein
MSDQTPSVELQFSSDFASRVLNEADAIARRRRQWQISALSLAAAGVAVAAVWSVPSFRNAAPVPAPARSQVMASGALSWPDEAGQADPMQWIFPDAQPVAQFANGYSDAMTGNAARRQQVLFGENVEQDESL